MAEPRWLETSRSPPGCFRASRPSPRRTTPSSIKCAGRAPARGLTAGSKGLGRGSCLIQIPASLNQSQQQQQAAGLAPRRGVGCAPPAGGGVGCAEQPGLSCRAGARSIPVPANAPGAEQRAMGRRNRLWEQRGGLRRPFPKCSDKGAVSGSQARLTLSGLTPSCQLGGLNILINPSRSLIAAPRSGIGAVPALAPSCDGLWGGGISSSAPKELGWGCCVKPWAPTLNFPLQFSSK